MSGRHARNTTAMQASPRCGARTRSGGVCAAPAANGKARCRMHGGVRTAGAPRGNRNARKHGMYTAGAIAEREQVKVLLDRARKLLQGLT